MLCEVMTYKDRRRKPKRRGREQPILSETGSWAKNSALRRCCPQLECMCAITTHINLKITGGWVGELDITGTGGCGETLQGVNAAP